MNDERANDIFESFLLAPTQIIFLKTKNENVTA